MLTASFLALFSDVPLICCILPVEKGEAGSGELEASGQRAAHQGEAEASLWGQGQCGAFVRMADPGWRGGLRNHWPRFCLDSKSKLLYVLTPQSCVSRALHPYLAGNGVPGVCLSWLFQPQVLPWHECACCGHISAVPGQGGASLALVFHLGLWGSLGRRPSLKLAAAVLPHHSTGPVPGQPVDMGVDLTSPTWGLHLGQRPHTVVCCGQDGVRQHGRVLRAVATTPVVSPHAALAFEKCFDHTPSNPSGGPCSWLYVLTSSLPPLCSRPLHSNPASTGGAALGRLAMGVGSVHWAGKDRHRALPFRNEGRHAEQLLATSHIGLYPP